MPPRPNPARKPVPRKPVPRKPVPRKPAPLRPAPRQVTPPEPKRGFFGTFKGGVGSVVGSVGNAARIGKEMLPLMNPYNRTNTERAGQYWANVPGVRQFLQTTQPVLQKPLELIKNYSGVTNLENATEAAKYRDTKEMWNQIGRGVINLGTGASVGKFATAPVKALNTFQKLGPVAKFFATAGAAGTAYEVPNLIRSTLNTDKYTRPAPPRGQSYTDDIGTYTWNPLSGIYELTRLGGSAYRQLPPRGQSYTDDIGTYTWNPLSGIYELTRLNPKPGTGPKYTPPVVDYPPFTNTEQNPYTDFMPDPSYGSDFGSVPDYGSDSYGSQMYGNASGTSTQPSASNPYSQELAALSPEEMEQLLEQAREAQRDYDSTINDIGRATATGEKDLRDYIRRTNRRTAGSVQDTNSALAQLGLDTSPAPQAYNQYIGAEGSQNIAGARSTLADVLADLRRKRGAAESIKLKRLRELKAAEARGRSRRTVEKVDYVR